ncbi:MAG: MFS transporter [Demequina sp.]
MRIVYLAYLASYALSMLGNAIAAVALPLIVLHATGSALSAGTVAIASVVPALIAGLLMGVVIDRINRLTSSIGADLISAASIAALPIVDAVTGLSLGWFILFGIVGSLGDVPGLTARDALLPAIVRHSGVTAERLVGLREALGAGAIVAGPAIAGFLMSVLEGSTVLWITAATSLAAALTTALIPRRVGSVDRQDNHAAPTPSTSAWQQFTDGWRGLLGSRLLLTVTTLGLVSVVVLGALQGLVLPVYFTLIDRPGALGLVLTALALGVLLGAGMYAAIGSRVQRRSWLVASVAGTTVGFAAIATLHSPWVVLAGAFLVGTFSGVFNSLLGVLLIEAIPEALRGRIMGTQNAVMTAGAPAGIFLAGALTEFAGITVAAVVITALWLTAAIIVLGARSLRHARPERNGHMEAIDAQQ